MQLRGDGSKFTRAGGRVVLIGLGAPARAEWFCEERKLKPFVCTSDPGNAAHRAYGLKRGSLRQVMGPRVYFGWAKARVLSDIPTPSWKPGEDIMQMPGTFVIDTKGIVRYAHRNRDVTDNPPNGPILELLHRLKGKT